MNDVERRALDLVNEVARERGSTYDSVLLDRAFVENEALCRAIEVHDAYRQEVSDAVEAAIEGCGHDGLRAEHIRRFLSRFIIQPKTDPLVEVIAELSPWNTSNRWNNDDFSDRLRAALAKRGLEIREVGEC